jgi:hypothetical protein
MGETAEEWNGEEDAVWPLRTQKLGILHHWEQLPVTDATPGLPTQSTQIKLYKF